MPGRDRDIRRRVRDRLGFHQRDDLLRRRERDRILTDDGDRCGFASTDAWRVEDAHVLAQKPWQFFQEVVRSGQVTRDRIADAHGDRRWRGLAFLHHVEVMVEGGHFVDLSHRHLHISRKRDEMRGREMPEAILDLVQVLDEQIAAPWRITEERADVLTRLRIDGATLGCPAHAGALAFAWSFDSHQDVDQGTAANMGVKWPCYHQVTSAASCEDALCTLNSWAFLASALVYPSWKSRPRPSGSFSELWHSGALLWVSSSQTIACILRLRRI